MKSSDTVTYDGYQIVQVDRRMARGLHITVVVVGEVDSPVTRADPHLDGIVAIIGSLRVVLEDNGLPWS